MRIGILMAAAIVGCAGGGSESPAVPEVRLLVLERQKHELCVSERLTLPSGERKTAVTLSLPCTPEAVGAIADQIGALLGSQPFHLSERNLLQRGSTVEDERLREALEVASGDKPEMWHVQEPVAWAFRTWEEGYWEEAMPVLVHVQGRWVPVPCESARDSRTLDWMELHDRWLLFSDNGHSHLIDLTTGQQVWSGPGTALLWPEGFPVVVSAQIGDGAEDPSSE